MNKPTMFCATLRIQFHFSRTKATLYRFLLGANPTSRSIGLLFVATVLLTLGYAAYRNGPRTSTVSFPRDAPLRVEVTGEDFFWRFRYSGPDGEFDTGDDLQVNELHLPIDAEVELRLTSDDYVYTLAIPALGQREIAVPGMFFTLKFRADAIGSFDMLADPLCAVRLFHDDYMGRVVVQPWDDFEAWFNERSGS